MKNKERGGELYGWDDGKEDPILALSGLGKEVWEGVDPDAYVRGLREGWE